MLQNPKIYKKSLTGKSSWYPYYAGYSSEFVRSIIKKLDLPKDCVILDPWNGSGTTTQIAFECGMKCYGFDINPAMTIVAKARLIDHTVVHSINPFINQILTSAARKRKKIYMENDPLSNWFDYKTINKLRLLEREIKNFVMTMSNINEMQTSYLKDTTEISSLMAFFYVVLFKTLHILLSQFKSTNPTWVKKAKSENSKLYYSATEIHKVFREQIVLMSQAIPSDESRHNSTLINIMTASSTKIPLENSTIDAIITSPPYCTRIDYAISTLPELSLLGFGINGQFRNLRENMIGTTTVAQKSITRKDHWGLTCTDFLSKVEGHLSKASKTYYLKTYLQYFDSIFVSMRELDRVLKKDGFCSIVVQDSYYKDTHLDLAKILIEMVTNNGWELKEQSLFIQNHPLSKINPKSAVYRSGKKAIESILIFKKTGE